MKNIATGLLLISTTTFAQVPSYKCVASAGSLHSPIILNSKLGEKKEPVTIKTNSNMVTFNATQFPIGEGLKLFISEKSTQINGQPISYSGPLPIKNRPVVLTAGNNSIECTLNP